MYPSVIGIPTHRGAPFLPAFWAEMGLFFRLTGDFPSNIQLLAKRVDNVIEFDGALERLERGRFLFCRPGARCPKL